MWSSCSCSAVLSIATSQRLKTHDLLGSCGRFSSGARACPHHPAALWYFFAHRVCTPPLLPTAPTRHLLLCRRSLGGTELASCFLFLRF
jgi:hypothetical protein